MVLFFHKQELQVFPGIYPKFDLYTFGVGTDQVCQVSSHTYTTFWGFQPVRKAGTGFRKLNELFGNHFLGDEVESLACMGIAMITIHTTHMFYIYMCVCLSVQCCAFRKETVKIKTINRSITKKKKVL